MILRKTEFTKYFKEKKEFYNHLLDFLDSHRGTQVNYQNLIVFEIPKIGKKREDLKEFLHLILKIANNHFRYPEFYNKIKQIILKLDKDIKQKFTNFEIFNIFKGNKLLLLFLLEKKIIQLDKTIANLILQKSEANSAKYSHFFYQEIVPLVEESERKEIVSEILKIDNNIFTNFPEKRQAGENDADICQLIRKDSLDEFIVYTKQNKVSLSSKINLSIFETNSFLNKSKETTLIEYSAFFGSIQIFKYLQANKVVIKPSIWLYAIHGNNPEIVHLLEASQIEPDDRTFERCLEEAIKCHHNEIAKHIHDNLLNKTVEKNNIVNNFNQNTLNFAFHYFNFEFMPKEFDDNKFIFFYACEFGHITLVELLLKDDRLKINDTIITKNKNFFNQISNKKKFFNRISIEKFFLNGI